MRLLLDTHTWLWFVLGDARLSSGARVMIETTTNDKFVSPASYWETAIKIRLGKYTLPTSYNQFIHQAIVEQGFSILPILPQHTAQLVSLPFHHRNPFDRLLIVQSLFEDMPLLSVDAQLDEYGIKRVW